MNYLIVGLGNPGDKYTGTRHNIGFDILDWLAGEWGAASFLSSRQAEAVTAEVLVSGEKIGLLKPLTFMNSSGVAVRKLADYFDISSEHILIIYDDVDLPLGSVKFATSRGSGGHRGMQSVIAELGTKEFARLRIGITPADESGAADKGSVSVPGKGINPFVLGQFQKRERETVEKRFADIILAAENWVAGSSPEAVMNDLH